MFDDKAINLYLILSVLDENFDRNFVHLTT